MAATLTEAVVIDLDQEWLLSLKSRLNSITLRRHHRDDDEPRTIFRVPINMREADPAAFSPKLISFGPFSPRNNSSTQQLKLRYVRKLLLRNASVTLVDILKLIKSLEPNLRNCYSEPIEIESNDFVEMMLLDACFLLELLIMQNDDKHTRYEYDDDPILTTNWMLPLVKNDVLMLENQIPYFLLQSILRLIQPTAKGSFLIEMMTWLFDDVVPGGKVPSDDAVPKYHHVLHFLHSYVMPKDYSQSTTTEMYRPLIYMKLGQIRRLSSSIYRRMISSFSSTFGSSRVNDEKAASVTPESVPAATELRESGVRFKAKKPKNSFLEVEFINGVMMIPTLRVNDTTNALFRNLIALEQCFPEIGTHVASYAVFMDCLIESRDDVELLQRKGCVVNGLGNDEEAAAMFSRMCKEVAVETGSCYLAQMFRDVKTHCDSRWNKWRAKLMRDYFENPWAVLSLVGALVLIVFTLVQTLCAVLDYFRPLQY